MRLLVIPAQTKLAAASPFHCCLVTTGSKRAFVLAPEPMLTIEVSPMKKSGSVTAITQFCVFLIRIISVIQVALFRWKMS
jgi:hypothetical protein